MDARFYYTNATLVSAYHQGLQAAQKSTEAQSGL